MNKKDIQLLAEQYSNIVNEDSNGPIEYKGFELDIDVDREEDGTVAYHNWKIPETGESGYIATREADMEAFKDWVDRGCPDRKQGLPFG